ncbi:MAG: hypothetical protein AAFX06_15405 [Planctomycetota bacterium]
MSPETPSEVNPYAPTAETSASQDAAPRNRHPSRWPLLIIGTLFAVSVVMTLITSLSLSGTVVRMSITLFVMVGLASICLLLALLPYTRLSRVVTFIVFGPLSALLGASLFIRLMDPIILCFLVVFLWIFFSAILRPAYRTSLMEATSA